MISLLELMILTLAAAIIGSAIIRVQGLDTGRLLDTAVISIGLGLAVLGYYTYAIGLVGALYPGYLLAGILILVVISGIISMPLLAGFNIKTHLAHTADSLRRLDRFSQLLLSLLSFNVLLNLIGAMSPETGFDALWYHLSIPEIYAANHKIYFISNNILSGHPRLFEMFYSLSLSLSAETLAKLFHFQAGIISTATIFAISKKQFDTRTALVASLVFYGMQPVNMLSATADIDLGLTMFVLLALMMILNYLDDKRSGWLVLSGFFAGCAVGTKYLGALAALALFVVLLWLYSQREIERFRDVSKFAIVAFIVFLPWLIDNYAQTGNPIYPLFNHYFNAGPSWELTVISDQSEGGWWPSHTPVAFFTLPWKLTMGDYDGWLSPLFLLLLPAIIFVKNKSKSLRALMIFTIVYFVLLFLLPYWIVRFFIPLAAILSLIAAASYNRYLSSDKLLRAAISSIIVLVLLTNIGFLFFKNGPLLPTALGFQARQDYLSGRLGWYEVNAFLETRLSGDDKVMVYGAQLFYYFDFDYLHDQPAPQGSPAHMAKQLSDKNIKYILLLTDNTGAQDLWDIKGWENVRGSSNFELVYTKAMPTAIETNTARGAKVYKILGVHDKVTDKVADKH